MKKVVSALICILLICMLAISVSAAESNASITPSRSTLQRGDTFTVTASLNNSDPIRIGQVVLSFDENVFKLTKVTCNVSGTATKVELPSQKVGSFLLAEPAVVSGNIFTFEFEVLDNAALGSYTITPAVSIGVETGSYITATATNVTIDCYHAYTYSSIDGQKHSWSCSKCGASGEDAHDWDDGAVTVAPSCSAPGKKVYNCRDCNATREETVSQKDHTYYNPCDTDCNICGAVRQTSHTYATTWSSDRTGHWYACTGCGAKNQFAAHVPGPAATSSTPQVCTVCNYQLAAAVTHQHTIDYSQWAGDEFEHWHRCTQSCSYTTDRETHEYDSGCDVDCNICGFIRMAPHKYRQEWLADATGHWQCCIDCFALSEPVSHVPGPEATETEPQRCLECGFVIEMELSHVHDFGEVWYCDDAKHWKSCANEHCFETFYEAPHEWDAGTVMENGDTVYICITCGKQRTVAGEAPNPPATEPTQPTTVPSSTTAPQKTEKSGGFPWEWAGLAAIVLLVIGIVLLVIEFIRSRKSNHRGKYSK